MDGREKVAGGGPTAASATRAASVPHEEEEEAATAAAAAETVWCDLIEPEQRGTLECMPVVFGNPAVESVEGCVLLYRREGGGGGVAACEVSVPAAPSSPAPPSASSAEDGGTAPPADRASTQVVCMRDIPAHVPIREIHQIMARFRGLRGVTHLQVVGQSAAPECYSLLLRYKDPEGARVFRETFDGRRFNSLEDDLCRVDLVHKVQFCRSVQGRRAIDPQQSASSAAAWTLSSAPRGAAEAPSSSSSSLLAAAASSPPAPVSPSSPECGRTPGVGAATVRLSCAHHGHSVAEGRREGGAKKKGPRPRTSHHLFPLRSDVAPVCPVCLEMVDPEASPMINILCNHVFHFECISQWADSTCPVCRYIMQPAAPSHCEECGVTERLWVCLICGHVGCGRYQMGHAARHFEESGHAFSLDQLTRRVWDYAEDEYVHRVVQNKADGKLVAVDRARRRHGRRSHNRSQHLVESMSSESVAFAAAPFSPVAAAPGAAGAAAATSDGADVGRTPDAALSASASASALAATAVAAAAAAAVAEPPGGAGRARPEDAMFAGVPVVPADQYATLKLEEILVEFNFVLHQELEAQRSHFEAQLEAQQRARAASLAAEEAAAISSEELLRSLRAQVDAATADLQSRKERNARTEKAFAAAEARNRELRVENRKMLQLQKARRMGVEALEAHLQEEMRRVVSEKDAEIASIEEQIGELQFHLKTQQQVDRLGGGANVRDGQLFVFADPEPADPKSSKKKIRKPAR